MGTELFYFVNIFGKDADLVILDENLNVIKTIVKGKVVYEGQD